MPEADTIVRPGAETVTTPDTTPSLSTDKVDSAHIVMVPEGEPDQTPQAYVLRASIEGFPVTAICGYTWVPGKDPRKLPICAECKLLFDTTGSDLEHRHNTNGGLPDA